MSGIVPLILGAIKDSLEYYCITKPTEDLEESSGGAGDGDERAIADVVKIGKFQDDPIKSNIYIAVSPGDPDDPRWSDGIVTYNPDNAGFRIDPREVGGGEVWWRRGVVKVGCYFIREKLSEEDAISISYTVLGRVQQALQTVSVIGLEDEFGERAFKVFVYAHEFFESGGPPTSYIWRGKVLWQCLTEKP